MSKTVPPPALRPAALIVTTAAPYCRVSPQYLNKQRHTDRKRIRAGLAPEGPPWLELGNGTRPHIRYLVAELDAWLARKGTETVARIAGMSPPPSPNAPPQPKPLPSKPSRTGTTALPRQ